MTLEEIRDELLKSKLIGKRNFKNLELELDQEEEEEAAVETLIKENQSNDSCKEEISQSP